MKRNQRGAALLTALFIVTLISILATSLSMRIPYDIERYKINANIEKANLYSNFVKLWTIEYLNRRNLKFVTDKQGKILIDLNDITKLKKNINTNVSIELYDLQSKFNLNNLTDKKLHISFLTLLEKLFPEANPQELKALLNNIYMWISPFEQYHIQLDETYAKKNPPYYPAHRPFHSHTELKLVKGVNNKIYQKLEPYITALPEVTEINVNSASKKILASLGNGLSVSVVHKIIEKRGEKGFKNNQEMQLFLRELNVPTFYTTTSSQYFLCKIIVEDEYNQVIKYLILKREKKRKKAIKTQIIRENSNSL